MYKLIVFNRDKSVAWQCTCINYEINADCIQITLEKGEQIGISGSPYIVVCTSSCSTELAWEEMLRNKKEAILKDLSEQCNKTIKKGFFSNTNKHFYAFDNEDQNNFNQQVTMLLLNPATPVIEWKTEDAGVIILTKDEFLKVIMESEEHKRGYITKYWMIKSKILAMNNIEDIESIGTFEDEIKKINTPIGINSNKVGM